jgi:hypothetical protein
MAWEERGQKSYFYLSARQGRRVQRVYYGTGEVGRLAAAADHLRRAEADAAAEVQQAQHVRLDEILALTRALRQAVELLTNATPLAAGYHRPCRHPWRRWRHGQHALQQTD